MGNSKYIGRIGALAVALGIGSFRRSATRMTVSIGAAAVVVLATTVPSPAPTASPAVRLAADSTALIVCGTTCPTWHQADVEVIMNQFITPTHPGPTITPIAVTTPGEAWPLTGILRLVGFAVGDPSFFGPGGAAWPDEPWWKLSGLFDLTTDQSIQAGVADLEQAMAAHGNDHLVIYGYSQGSIVANLEKRKLAEQYPAGTAAPDIDFVLGGDFNVPNGGLHARFPGLYIPVLDWSFNGPEPTNTPFHTDVITRQYDGVADFPLYPLNVIADLNAVLGFLYVHTYPFDVSLAPDPTTSPAYQGTHGDTSYYFFETPNLPLFDPLRTLGVPEPLIDVVEPFFRALVELGYDRTIPPWEPTPARLIPTLNPGTVATDLVNAASAGIDNAAALFGTLAPLSVATVKPTDTTLGTAAAADVSSQQTTLTTQTTTDAGLRNPNQTTTQTGLTNSPQSAPALTGPSTSTSPPTDATQVLTSTPTGTPAQSSTSTPTGTPTQSSTSTPTGTPTQSSTSTPTGTPTQSSTRTGTESNQTASTTASISPPANRLSLLPNRHNLPATQSPVLGRPPEASGQRPPNSPHNGVTSPAAPTAVRDVANDTGTSSSTGSSSVSNSSGADNGGSN
jgi:hypothetical protein